MLEAVPTSTMALPVQYKLTLAILRAGLSTSDPRQFIKSSLDLLIDQGFFRASWLYLAEANTTAYSLFAASNTAPKLARRLNKNDEFVIRLHSVEQGAVLNPLSEDDLGLRTDHRDANRYQVKPFNIEGVHTGFLVFELDRVDGASSSQYSQFSPMIELITAGYSVLNSRRVSAGRSKVARKPSVNLSAGFHDLSIPHILVNSSMEIVEINPVANSLLARSPADLVGQSIATLYPSEDWELLSTAIEDITSTRPPWICVPGISPSSAEQRSQAYSHVIIPIYGASGSIENLSITLNPTQGRPGNTPAEQVALLEQLIGSAPISIFVADLDGKLRFALGGLRNKRHNQGRRRSVGADIFNLGQPTVPRSFIANSLIYSGRIQLTVPDQDEYVKTWMSVVEDPKTRTSMVVGVILDVTEHVGIVKQIESERLQMQTVEDLYRSAVTAESLEDWFKFAALKICQLIPDLDLTLQPTTSGSSVRVSSKQDTSYSSKPDAAEDALIVPLYGLHGEFGVLRATTSRVLLDGDRILINSIASATSELIRRIESDCRHREALAIDSVTGLKFTSEIPSMISRLRASGYTTLQCLLIKCHSIHEIGMLLGSDASAELLIAWRAAIQTLLDDNYEYFESASDDLLIIGGLTADASGLEQAELEELVAILQGAVAINGVTTYPEATFGVSVLDTQEDKTLTVEECGSILISCAQAANDFARSKQLAYSIYDPSLSLDKTEDLIRLGRSLNDRVLEGSLGVVFLPVRGADGIKQISVEYAPTLIGDQQLDNQEIRVLAATTGQSLTLDWRLIDAALASIKHTDKEIVRDFKLRIRVSGDFVKSTNCATRLVERIESSGLTPESLIIEVGEQELDVEPERFIQPIEELNRSGIGVALADFGTGVASLGNIELFKVQGVSLSPLLDSAVSGLGSEAMLVKSVVELADETGLEITATVRLGHQEMNRLFEAGCRRFVEIGAAFEDLGAVLRDPNSFCLADPLSA